MPDPIEPASAVLAEALTRRDPTAAAALYAESGRLITSGDLIAGREQIEAYWQAGMALGLSRVAMIPVEVRVGDQVAVEAGRYELVLSGCPGTSTSVDCGSYLAVHRRDAAGSWRRVIDVFDADPLAPERAPP